MAIISGSECDKCHTFITFSHTSKHIVKDILRKKGWSFGEQDLCPNCNGRGKNKSNQNCKNISI